MKKNTLTRTRIHERSVSSIGARGARASFFLRRLHAAFSLVSAGIPKAIERIVTDKRRTTLLFHLVSTRSIELPANNAVESNCYEKADILLLNRSRNNCITQICGRNSTRIEEIVSCKKIGFKSDILAKFSVQIDWLRRSAYRPILLDTMLDKKEQREGLNREEKGT